MKTFEIAPANEFLRSIKETFLRYKTLGENTFAQLDEEDYYRTFGIETNTIAVLVRHIGGNLVSRFTDFLTSDGEKPERDRDKEFEMERLGKQALLEYWNHGFEILENTLHELDESDLSRIVFIRNEPHSVPEALIRSLGHISYHIGQIVYIGKMSAGEWRSLSIPKGESGTFNAEKFSKPKRLEHFSDEFTKNKKKEK